MCKVWHVWKNSNFWQCLKVLWRNQSKFWGWITKKFLTRENKKGGCTHVRVSAKVLNVDLDPLEGGDEIGERVVARVRRVVGPGDGVGDQEAERTEPEARLHEDDVALTRHATRRPPRVAAGERLGRDEHHDGQRRVVAHATRVHVQRQTVLVAVVRAVAVELPALGGRGVALVVPGLQRSVPALVDAAQRLGRREASLLQWWHRVRDALERKLALVQ